MSDALYKTDINFEATPTGGIDRINGLDNVKKRIFRRIMTTQGTIAWRPTYGVGLKNYQNATLNLGLKREIGEKITEQVGQDISVNKVLGVSINRDSSIEDMTIIAVRVDVFGHGEQTFKYEVGDMSWR